jgi:hypothetical protein
VLAPVQWAGRPLRAATTTTSRTSISSGNTVRTTVAKSWARRRRRGSGGGGSRRRQYGDIVRAGDLGRRNSTLRYRYRYRNVNVIVDRTIQLSERPTNTKTTDAPQNSARDILTTIDLINKTIAAIKCLQLGERLLYCKVAERFAVNYTTLLRRHKEC